MSAKIYKKTKNQLKKKKPSPCESQRIKDNTEKWHIPHDMNNNPT